MKTLTTQNTRRFNHGYASVLTVLSVGFFLMMTLSSIYMITIESQLTVRNNTLRGDYQQREDAFLSAMVTYTATTAIKCMQDDSEPWAVRKFLQWHDIMDLALTASNASVAVDDATLSGLGFQPDSMTRGLTADAASGVFGASTVTDQIYSTGHTTPSIGQTASVNYPAPLMTDNNGLSVGRGSNFPSISHLVHYGSTASGWVGADVDEYPQYNIVPSPSSHFNYNNSDTLIAKHNWWAFTLNFADQDKSKTELTNTDKNYIISIYEIPSQLALSANSVATLGAFSDGTEWNSQIKLTGALFAEDLTTTGDFSADALTSRKGITISDSTSINNTTITGATTGNNPMESNERELAESSQTAFPIHSSSDGGKVAFIPINRDISFYDRFSGKGSITEADSVTQGGNNSVARSSWDYYSNGAHQCAMHLDIIDVNTASDQTVKELQFTYYASGSQTTVYFSTSDGSWPVSTSPEGLLFPFHSIPSDAGTPQLAVYLERIAPYLATKSADLPEINHSLSINVDYTDSTNTGIQNPSDDYGAANAILLKDAKNISAYTKGFSLVTNMRLIVDGSVNTSAATSLPTDYILPAGETFYPPVSIFAPEKRYGNRSTVAAIEINGQVASIAETSGATTNPLDFKSGTGGVLNTSTVTANLTSITHPGELPPINLMNWMIVIRPL